MILISFLRKTISYYTDFRSIQSITPVNIANIFRDASHIYISSVSFLRPAKNIILTGLLASGEGEDLLWLPVQYEACKVNNSAFSGRYFCFCFSFFFQMFYALLLQSASSYFGVTGIGLFWRFIFRLPKPPHFIFLSCSLYFEYVFYAGYYNKSITSTSLILPVPYNFAPYNHLFWFFPILIFSN